MIQWMNTGDSYWWTSNTAWLLLVVKQLKGARRYLRILPTSVDEVMHRLIKQSLHQNSASNQSNPCHQWKLPMPFQIWDLITEDYSNTPRISMDLDDFKRRCTYNFSRWLPGLGSPSSSGKTRTHQCHNPPWSWPAFPDCSQPWFPQRPWKQGQHGQLQVRIECSGP